MTDVNENELPKSEGVSESAMKMYKCKEPEFMQLPSEFIENMTGSHRGEIHTLDSLSEIDSLGPRPINEETLTITFVNEGKTRATWRGKTLEERKLGDWATSNNMTVDRRALALAWKTKFKEAMPLDLSLGVSMEGEIRFGGHLELFGAPVRDRRLAGKHSGSKIQQRNKTKRRK